MKKQQPKIKEIHERTVAYLSYTGNYMGNPQIFTDLFNRINGWAGPLGLITPDTVFLASYQDDPETTPPDEMKLNLCMSVSDDTEASGDIRKMVLPGGRYVSMEAELDGPEEYGAAWYAVVDWIKANDFKIDMTRPSYEFYLNNPAEHPEGHHIVDICMSVE